MKYSVAKHVVQWDVSIKHYRVRYKNGIFYANGLPIANAEPKLGKRAMVFPTPINDKFDKPVYKVVSTMVAMALPYWSLVYEHMKVRGTKSGDKFIVEKKLFNNEWVDIDYIKE